MNRGFVARSRLAPRPPPHGSASPGGATRPKKTKQPYGMVYAGLLWALILYISIPWDIFAAVKENTQQIGTGNSLSRAIKLILMGVAALLIGMRWSLSVQLLRRTNMYFVLFLALVALSVGWSIDSGATLARFITLMSFVLVCFAFTAGSWHPQRFQAVIRPILTLLLFGSLIFGLMAPDLAIEQGEGTLKDAWHGLMGQKNQLGQLAGFGTILWLHAYLSNQTNKLLALAGMALSFCLAVFSRSSTSLFATLLACVLMLMMLRMPKALRRYIPYLVATFATVVIVYAVAILKLIPGLDFILTPITSMTGKDLTFSNRSEIWAIIKEHVQFAPYLGSGYGAYWTGPVPTSPSYVFLGRMYFYPTESHNGYLEIMNDLGFVGLTILVGYLLVYVRQCLHLMRVDRLQAALFLCLFFHQLINNLTETSWLSTTGSLTTTVMSLATLATARCLLEESKRTAPNRPAVARRRTIRGSRGYASRSF